VLEEMLNLPRESAIEDLVGVIQHAIFDIDDEEWEYDFSVIHALLLLSHFRAEEKLPFLLKLFSVSDDWIEEMIYDFLTEDLPLVFYYCGQNQVPVLSNFIKDFSAKNVYAKSAALDAMILIARKDPDRKPEIQQALHDLFDFLLSQENEELIQTDDFYFACSDLCGAVMGFGDQHFFEKAKMLYERDWVDPFMFGVWEEYEKDFNESIGIKFYPNIRAWYQEVGKSRDQSLKKKDLFTAPKPKVISSTPGHNSVKAEPKIGRNDPCPCGSGKKYKKCHGKV
jgi:Protein of unknown function (DUF1186)/SEC-C motif